MGEAHYPETHLIPLAIEAALGGAPLTVFGSDYPTPDGSCVRDYIHVADLARAHDLALQVGGLDTGFEAMNLGRGVGSSVREIIAAVSASCGRPPAVVEGGVGRAIRRCWWRILLSRWNAWAGARRCGTSPPWLTPPWPGGGPRGLGQWVSVRPPPDPAFTAMHGRQEPAPKSRLLSPRSPSLERSHRRYRWRRRGPYRIIPAPGPAPMSSPFSGSQDRSDWGRGASLSTTGGDRLFYALWRAPAQVRSRG